MLVILKGQNVIQLDSVTICDASTMGAYLIYGAMSAVVLHRRIVWVYKYYCFLSFDGAGSQSKIIFMLNYNMFMLALHMSFYTSTNVFRRGMRV